MSSSDGNPIEFKDGWTGSITLPEGVLYAAADESIINKDIVVNFLGATPKPEILEPEYVTVDVTVNGIHTTSQEFVKGKTFKLQLAHDDWEVESLRRFNGNADESGTDITDYITDGVYTSSAIKDNTRFVAVLKYANPLIFDNTTGVADLEELNLRVYSEKENIVVEGLQGGEHITVYSMAGLVIGEHDVPATYDELIISAAKGQAYIVRIQRGDKVQAAKIMH